MCIAHGIAVVLLVALCSGAITKEQEIAQCSACTNVVGKAYSLLTSPTPTYDETVDVVTGLCDTFDNKTLAEQCTTLIDDDSLSLSKLLFTRVPVPDICISARQCAMPAVPPPAAPVLISQVDAQDAATPAANGDLEEEVVNEKVEQRTRAIKDQAALELKHAQDIAQSMAPTINVAAPPPSGGGSGLAWDKHDFDVANNKGGDVEVEVNMAAPMSSGDDDSNSGLEDLGPLLESLLAPQEPDPLSLLKLLKPQPVPTPPPLNLTELFDSIRSLIPSPPPPPAPAPIIPAPPPPAIDLSWLKDLIQPFKPAPPPPPAPQLDIPAIIEALHPPPQPLTPPVDIASLMREMRAAMEAGRAPPPPPAGIDPSMMELLKQMMQDLKDMHDKLNEAPSSTPIVLPPIVTPTPPPMPTNEPVPSYEPYPTPDPHAGEGSLPPPPPSLNTPFLTMDDLQAHLQDMLKNFQPALPLPPMPPSSNSDLEQLKALLAQQLAASSKPIMLPPPVVPPNGGEQSNLMPPPPPPPSSGVGNLRDTVMDLLNSHLGKPQRIPAPPVITGPANGFPPGPCCSAPPPDETRADTERCPKVNGVTVPRCKRRQPPALPARCRPRPCGSNPVTDQDGDVNVDLADKWNGLPFCESSDCGEGTLAYSDFNPKALLSTLCAGGKCPDANAKPTIIKPNAVQAQSSSM